MRIVRTIIAGMLAGLAFFLMPFFLIRLLVIILLFKAAFRLLGFGGRGRFMHRFKNMTEEERAAYMQQYGHRCGPFRKETDTQPAA